MWLEEHTMIMINVGLLFKTNRPLNTLWLVNRREERWIYSWFF